MKKYLIICSLLLALPFLVSAQVITWGSRVRVDDAPGDATHPASRPYTIIDDSLRIYSVWEDDRDNDGKHAIYFARSNDRGLTFSANIVIAPDIADNLYPWMVKGGNNSIYLVWQALVGSEWKIYFSKSVNGGASFSQPDTIYGISVHNTNQTAVPAPRIAVDPKDSILYLVWADEGKPNPSARVMFARSLTRDINFTDTLRVSLRPDTVYNQPSIDVGGNGKVYLSFQKGSDPKPFIVFNQSSDYGLSFGPKEIKVNSDTTQVKRINPSVTRLQGKTAVIFWKTGLINNAAPNLYYSQKFDSDSSFSPNVQIDAGSGVYNFWPRMAIDRTNGNMVVAWHSNSRSDGFFELRMCPYNDTIGQFRPSNNVPGTYTGTITANLGKEFYPPALAIANIDSVTNFFLVWQDLADDQAGNIYCIRGTVTKTLVKTNLEELKVYPNPFKKWLGYGNVIFENLTATATIKIFDIKGRLVTTIEETNGDGEAIWTPNVASGIYLYLATNPHGQKKTGKIAIMK